MTESFSGKAEGFGFSVKQHKNGLKIKNIIKNSPAEKAGLIAGDIIIEVDGISTTKYSAEEFSQLIKNKIWDVKNGRTTPIARNIADKVVFFKLLSRIFIHLHN